MSWRRFFRGRRGDGEPLQEIEGHIAEEIAENISRGMSEVEAKRRARIKFGSPTTVRESLWQQNAIPLVDSHVRDFRYGGRTLLHTRLLIDRN